ncbi:MAG: lipocalin family protein [Candidatus Omnitrophica bacterium]|nr:lipocalin family protein [Candidatus Omnitrophota bacterium]
MIIKKLLVIVFLLSMTGCATSLPPLKAVEHVDLKRYMGPWYVIACIPTFIETKAYNGVEEYRTLPDGSIDTVFTFNQGSFDGPKKRYNPRGFVVDKINNSTWGMQFIWPFKAEYLITYLSPDYGQTIISRSKRDYFWIQARTPQISETDYKSLLSILAAQGYDISKVRRVPQRWNDKKENL